MSEALAIEQGAYEAPKGLEDFADRETADGKRLILYIGDVALLDIIEPKHEEADEIVPDRLLLRLKAAKEQAMDLFHHPAPFASTEDALRIFERQKDSHEVEAA